MSPTEKHAAKNSISAFKNLLRIRNRPDVAVFGDGKPAPGGATKLRPIVEGESRRATVKKPSDLVLPPLPE
jgi:hypothetical protein